MRPRAAPPLLALVGALLGGCIQPLDPASIVRTPRILAIVAEPPEARPGQDVVFRAMIAIPDGAARPLSLRWTSCVDPERLLAASGIRVDLGPDRPCDEAILAEDEPYVVAGERTQAAIGELRMLAGFGGFNRQLVDRLVGTVGLAYEVDVEVRDAAGTVLVAGYKRGAITTRDPPTTNPPPPAFRLDATAIVATGELFRCAAEDGSIVRAAAGSQVELAPILPEGAEEEPWLETFPIIDYTGGLLEGRENAYYSWFATAGSWTRETTRPPERSTVWRTPQEPGPQTLWLVVRDGHLGTSACRLEVEVAAPTE
jgi:hypothetical protein